jgi:hypothetical protein
MSSRSRGNFAALIFGVACATCGDEHDRVVGHDRDAAVSKVDASGANIDSGKVAPLMDATSLSHDAMSGNTDASVNCRLLSDNCPAGCTDLSGWLYNQHRRCLENHTELVGCWPRNAGYFDDPRCARRITTGEMFRVPLSFLEPLVEPNWSDCTAEDINFVSSTVTPRCDDLDDGGVYDGTP